jgi:cell division protease FtsH
MDIKPLAKLPL